MRLTKFNEETGQYEYIEKAKTLDEYRAQRKAAIQRLGEYEENAESRADMKVCGFTAKELAEKCERLAVENEGLKESNKQIVTDAVRSVSRANAKIEALRGVKSEYETFIGELKPKIDTIRAEVRADTVRKMHFEIQQRCIKGGIYPAFVGCTVDKVAYEMTGDEFYIAKFRMEDVEGNE